MRFLRILARNVWFWLPVVVVLIFAYSVIYFALSGRIAVREQQFRQRQRMGLLTPSATAAAGTAMSAALPRAPVPASSATA